MRIVLRSQEPALRIRHLTEVVFDKLRKVSGWLDFVQGAKAAGLCGRCSTSCISEGGSDAGCSGRVGALLTGGKVVGGEVARRAFEGCGGVAVAGFGFTLGAKGFGFQAVDFLVFGQGADTVGGEDAGHTMFLTCSGVTGARGRTPGLEGAVCGGGVEGRSAIATVDG